MIIDLVITRPEQVPTIFKGSNPHSTLIIHHDRQVRLILGSACHGVLSGSLAPMLLQTRDKLGADDDSCLYRRYSSVRTIQTRPSNSETKDAEKK